MKKERKNKLSNNEETIVSSNHISTLLSGKSPSERANLKSFELSKIGSLNNLVRDNYNINIKEIKQIDGGIELLVDAKNNGMKVGFGKDGSVEFERIKIYNPPILVPTTKRIEIVDGYETEVYDYIEDPEEALKQVVLETVKAVGKDGSNIIPGKVGKTTYNIYSQPGNTGSVCDGFVSRNGVDETFTIIRAGSGVSASTSGTIIGPILTASTTTDQFSNLQRNVISYDTSVLSGKSISSASNSVYITSHTYGLGSDNLYITGITPASDSDLIGSDYDKVLSTNLGSVGSASIGVLRRNLGLNSDGINYIDKTGITNLSIRLGWDFNNSFTGSWATSAFTRYPISATDVTGTTQDPYLLVEASSESTITGYSSICRVSKAVLGSPLAGSFVDGPLNAVWAIQDHNFTGSLHQHIYIQNVDTLVESNYYSYSEVAGIFQYEHPTDTWNNYPTIGLGSEFAGIGSNIRFNQTLNAGSYTWYVRGGIM